MSGLDTTVSARRVWGRRARRFSILAALLAVVALTIVRLEASLPEVGPLEREFDGPGKNVDDPCFWVDPADPARALIFITAKDSGLVEVFDAVSGAFVATIPGFGIANNCAVEGELLLTTDRGHDEVTVHHIPDLTLVMAFGQDMREPEGIDVLNLPGGRRMVYVTDSSDASVHVYDLATGALVRAFPTGFGAGIEPIFADDEYQRIYVGRGEKESARGVGLFEPDGRRVLEFGADVFSKDVEGMAVYACGDGGYLVIADQLSSATEFEVFDRVTLGHVGTFTVQDGNGEFTNSTDGIDILQTPLPGLPNGVLAACDGCGSTLPDEMDMVSWDRVADVLGLDVCPGGAAPDCIATPCVRRIVATADAHVDRGAPNTNFGGEQVLEVERDPPAEHEIFLRFEVPDLSGFELVDAALHITVAKPSRSASDDGGTLYRASSDWTEDGVTFNNRPASLGAPLDAAGPVASLDRVELDVGSVVTGGGTFDFVVRSASADKAAYSSREAGARPPTLVLRLLRDNPPSVAVTSPADGTSIAPEMPVTLTGSAADGDGTDLSATIRWRSDLDGDLGQGATLTLPGLSPGRHRITAEVIDAFDVTATAAVTVTVNTPPAVSITAPSDGSRFPAGQPVALAAAATDVEDGDLSASVAWSSSRDGTLGSGASLSAPTLSVGSHVITASVTDALGDRADDRLSVTVVGPPTVDIVSPGDGASVPAGSPLGFAATAVDATDGDLGPGIEWTSDRDGPLGTGASIVVNLKEGAHVVSASARNSTGAAGVDRITVVVAPTPPAVAVSAPADGASIVAGDLLRLAGRAIDAGDGDLSHGLIWESDVQGLLGTGASIIADALVPATHVVTARVTDSSGLSGRATLTVHVHGATVELPADADAYVEENSPNVNLGAAPILMADVGPDREVFLRFVVPPSMAGVVIERATLRLTVSGVSGSPSEQGGTLRAMSESGWVESAVTYANRPVIDGPVLGTIGPVARGDVVEVDVTPALAASGAVSFALVTPSDDGVKYQSRETGAGGPKLVLGIRSSGGLDPRPTVSISTPTVGTVVEQGTPVTLSAVASDPNDGDLSAAVSWESDLVGPLGTGSLLTVSGLPPGEHAIRAEVVDAEGLSATDSTTVLAVARPVVTILSPAHGAVVEVNDPVALTVSATDLEDGDLSAAVAWGSDVQGFLGTGATLAAGGLALGTHVLTASVVDAHGLTVEASVSIEVLATTVAIPAEADAYVDAADPGRNFGVDEALIADADPDRRVYLRFLVAGAGDARIERAILRLTVGAGLGAASVNGGMPHAIGDTAWGEDTVSWDTRPAIDGGPLGTSGPVADGETVEFDVTPAVHGDGLVSFALVTLSEDGVTYNSREAASGQPVLLLDLRVASNTAPLVAITSPLGGAEIEGGAPVSLAATAVDLEDGDLSGTIFWSSDRDGPLGTGAAVSADLSAGTHALLATVLDSDGVIGSATVTVTVIPPTMVFDVAADAFVVETVPSARFGSDTHLILKSAGPVIQGFLRFNVTGIEGKAVRRATLRLTVDVSPSAGGPGGGALHAVSDNGWQEMTVSYGSRPPVDGPVLATAGAVQPGEVVEFDATPAIHGDGTYVFAVVGTASDPVVYRSREAVGGEPQLVVSFGPG